MVVLKKTETHPELLVAFDDVLEMSIAGLRTGLKVITSINTKQYLNKREVRQEFRDNIENYIIFDDKRPKWNYLIKGTT